MGDAAKALDLDSDESIENQARLELRDLFEKSDTWETIEVFHTKNALPPSESQSNASSSVISTKMKSFVVEITQHTEAWRAPSSLPTMLLGKSFEDSESARKV